MAKENGSQKEGEITKTERAPLTPVESPYRTMDLIGDEELLGVYAEIMTKLRDDRKEVANLVDVFADMVINEGDSSTSSKEALVNLVKQKTDTVDKMGKIAELMTRIKLKQPYGEYKPYLNKGGGGPDTINIYDQGGFNKKSLIDAIDKAKKKQEEKE